MEYNFIVNPCARSGKGKLIWDRLEPVLKKKRIAYHAYLTRCAGDAADIARRITEDGREHILAVLGGDGTVNEVLNGICNIRKSILGYIPIGSSNDFARGMQIPREPEEALELILESRHIREMDVGVMSRKEKQRRFAVSAGIGFDAAVCHEVCLSKWKRILNVFHLGKLSYAVVALRRLIKDPTGRARICLDTGEEMVCDRTYFIAGMNQKYEGGGFRFCPQASAQDGKLDVIIVEGISKWKILCLLPTAFWGGHVRFKGVSVRQCKSMEVHLESPLPIHTDGEPVFLRDEMKVCLMPDKIRVIAGC